MHHDSQPLFTRGRAYGLLNQVRLLRQAGAISLQVLMMTPATGSRFYEGVFSSGRVYASAAGRPVEPYMLDANYVVASEHPQSWRKQLNIMAAYLYFYNPLRFLIALVRPKSKLYLADALLQLIGMWGLTRTIRRTFGWAMCLLRGDIRRRTDVPVSPLPMCGIGGEPASHALPVASVGQQRRPDRTALPSASTDGWERTSAAGADAGGVVEPSVIALPFRVDPAT
jgi:hypothetical protein